jgi:hypothetical protein
LWPAAGGALLLVGALAGAWIRRAEAVLACLAGALALTVGAVFPALRVNEIPPDVIQTMVRHPTAHFASPYPGTASMQVGRSLPYFGTSDTKALHDWARHTGFLVMRAEDYDDLEVACRTLGVLVTPVKDFRMLYSRGSFMRITRAGVTPEEWRKAFRERSLEDLTPRFLLVQLRLQPQGSTS